LYLPKKLISTHLALCYNTQQYVQTAMKRKSKRNFYKTPATPRSFRACGPPALSLSYFPFLPRHTHMPRHIPRHTHTHSQTHTHTHTCHDTCHDTHTFYAAPQKQGWTEAACQKRWPPQIRQVPRLCIYSICCRYRQNKDHEHN